jgi:hypothetical protein
MLGPEVFPILEGFFLEYLHSIPNPQILDAGTFQMFRLGMRNL